MAAHFVYVVTPHRDAASDIARDLVEARLVACANILDGMTSVYRWDGEIRQDQETVLILKTTQQQLAAVVDRVCKIHPYDCPCVAAWPITAGNDNYLQWIERETRSPSDSGD